jgi:hypothetical protein
MTNGKIYVFVIVTVERVHVHVHCKYLPSILHSALLYRVKGANISHAARAAGE